MVLSELKNLWKYNDCDPRSIEQTQLPTQTKKKEKSKEKVSLSKKTRSVHLRTLLNKVE